ncbi:MAG: hypothetical protein ABWW69_07130 [Pyrodictiaceae archaeon]
MRARLPGGQAEKAHNSSQRSPREKYGRGPLPAHMSPSPGKPLGHLLEELFALAPGIPFYATT